MKEVTTEVIKEKKDGKLELTDYQYELLRRVALRDSRPCSVCLPEQREYCEASAGDDNCDLYVEYRKPYHLLGLSEPEVKDIYDKVLFVYNQDVTLNQIFNDKHSIYYIYNPYKVNIWDSKVIDQIRNDLDYIKDKVGQKGLIRIFDIGCGVVSADYIKEMIKNED